MSPSGAWIGTFVESAQRAPRAPRTVWIPRLPQAVVCGDVLDETADERSAGLMEAGQDDQVVSQAVSLSGGQLSDAPGWRKDAQRPQDRELFHITCDDDQQVVTNCSASAPTQMSLDPSAYRHDSRSSSRLNLRPPPQRSKARCSAKLRLPQPHPAHRPSEAGERLLRRGLRGALEVLGLAVEARNLLDGLPFHPRLAVLCPRRFPSSLTQVEEAPYIAQSATAANRRRGPPHP